MTQVLLAPSFDLALTVVPGPVLTVEAEYGSAVVEGSIYTAAHHQPSGPYAGRHTVEGGRPSPCNDPSIPVIEEGTVLVSHLDLDTLGGLWRAQGRTGLFLRYAGFWNLAEYVDVNGPHRVASAHADERDVDMLNAWWAYSRTMPRFPRDRVSDISEAVRAAGEVIARILTGDEELLAAGRAFREAEAELNRRTFRSMTPDLGIIVRVAEAASDFCNHLYADPEGMSGGDSAGRHAVVVCHNTATGSVTISISEPLPGFSCRELVQALWGPEAGGHDGIAGSPRGRVMTEDDLWRMTMLVDSALCDCLAAQATA